MGKQFVLACCMAGLLFGAWNAGCGDPQGSETVVQDAGDKQEPTTGQDGGGTEPAPPEQKTTPEPSVHDQMGPDAPVKTPTIGELKANQWNMVVPPKDSGAICSRGTDYAFFVWPGDSKKVVIDFEGGGACWDASSCSIGDALFKSDIENLKKLLETGYDKGIYNRSNEKNPFKGWTHIYVPYCTGDIHWGDNIKEYTPNSGEPFTIRHKGAVNARAVLKWTYDNVKEPEKIFSTGCSAGSYGSIIWSAHIAKQYPNASLYQFGDSGAGVVTANFLKNSFPSWNAEQAAPAWVDGLDPTKVKIADQDLSYMYIKIGAHYKNLLFSQFNTAFDETQVFFFQAMGGGKAPKEWSDQMRAQIKKIVDSTPNFRSYIAAGKKHCIIPYDEFYTYEVDGRKLVDWVTDMVNGKDIKTLSCEGDACNP
jgi:hypothetical protein